MDKVSFVWDEKKSVSNSKKHGVTFEEASSVFYDENAIEFFDNENSNQEDRFLMLGMSSSLRLLLVCHCYREDTGKIRIISARKATKKECGEYYR